MDKKQGETSLKIKIIICELLLISVLLYTMPLFLTGNAVNESTNQSSCKLAWQPCFSSADCCLGLNCLGGTCKTAMVNSNETTNESTNQSSCKLAWQPCLLDSECCSGLSCQGGTCKTAMVNSNETTNESTTSSFNESFDLDSVNSPDSFGLCNNLEQSCDYNSDCCDKLICLKGTCSEKKITCVDSDGGKTVYLKGYTSGFNSNREYNFFNEDTCRSDIDIEEFYCENETVVSTAFSCLNGCENGICNCKYSSQECSSSLECCYGFNCVNHTCVSQTDQVPSSLKNRFICTFIGYSCQSDDDCCSKNCVPSWKFLFWEGDIKECGPANLR